MDEQYLPLLAARRWAQGGGAAAAAELAAGASVTYAVSCASPVITACCRSQSEHVAATDSTYWRCALGCPVGAARQLALVNARAAILALTGCGSRILQSAHAPPSSTSGPLQAGGMDGSAAQHRSGAAWHAVYGFAYLYSRTWSPCWLCGSCTRRRPTMERRHRRCRFNLSRTCRIAASGGLVRPALLGRVAVCQPASGAVCPLAAAHLPGQLAAPGELGRAACCSLCALVLAQCCLLPRFWEVRGEGMDCCALVMLFAVMPTTQAQRSTAKSQSSRDPYCAAMRLSPPQGWTVTQLALLASTDLSVRSAPPVLTLLLVGLWNGSLFM